MKTFLSSTPTKGRKIVYWIATILLALVFIYGGINDILKQPPYYEMLLKFGYPSYLSVIIGVWKLLGVLAILIRRFPRIKEWAYAGFFILIVCALSTRLAVHDDTFRWIFDILILGIIITSWALRPPSRSLEGKRF